MTNTEKSNGLATVYLLTYNIGQCVGWSTILGLMALQYMQTGKDSGMYEQVKLLLNIFQTAALLEVLHAILGLVKSNPILTGFQVMSRIFITWHVYYVPTVQDKVGAPLFLLAWSITEVIRYSFYACSLLGSSPYFIQWCRYTFFIILYPVGVTGELLSVYLSLPYVKKFGLLTATLPNAVNMSFDYYIVLHFIMLSYIPIFPQLYMHMFKQRGKVLGAAKSKSE